MKRILLLLLLLTNISFSQKLSKEERQRILEDKKERIKSEPNSLEELSFILSENKKVTWQKIYPVNLESDSLTKSLKTYLKNNFFTSQLNLIDNKFIGQSTKVKLSSTKGVAMGALTPFTAYVKIDIKNNRYRVSVTDIIFDGTEVGVSSGSFSISSATPLTLEDFVVRNKKNEFRKNNTALSLLKVINKDFENYFNLKEISNEDDW